MRTSVAGGQAATVLLEREVGSRPLRMLAPLDTDISPAMWITQGAEYGLIAPTQTPRLYHSRSWPGPQFPLNEYAPLAARGQPYYPTARAALFELLYGRTSPAGNASPLYPFEVSLAYEGAYLGERGLRSGRGHDCGRAWHTAQQCWRTRIAGRLAARAMPSLRDGVRQ